MREDLNSFLRPQESIVFVGDVSDSGKSRTPFTVQTAAIVFFSSFFVLTTIGLVVGGLIKGGTWVEIALRLTSCVVLLVLLATALSFCYQMVFRALKLTSIIITNERLFHAPAAESVKAKGWTGPHKGADLELIEQLSVAKIIYEKRQCLKFTQLYTPTLKGEHKALSTRIIPVKQIAEAFEAIPNYLKDSEVQFVEIEGEVAEIKFRRASKFLEERRTALSKPKFPSNF